MLVRTKSRTETMAPETQTDGQLLAEIATSASQDPFEELVRRHGRMVFNVCCRFLGETHDAEDAAQAVFLVLWQKARSLTGRSSVAGWLHHVAWNISRRARAASDLRKTREREAAEMAEQLRVEKGQWEQIKDVLDDELDTLPEKYRVAILLFHLEGRSLEETAALLGTKNSTVGTRLSRGRELLRTRLARRGTIVSVVALGGLLTEKTSMATVPATFTATTVKAAGLFAAGEAAAGGLISTQAAVLTQGALKMLYVAKLKAAAAVVAAATVVTSGGVIVYQAAGDDAAKETFVAPEKGKTGKPAPDTRADSNESPLKMATDDLKSDLQRKIRFRARGRTLREFRMSLLRMPPYSPPWSLSGRRFTWPLPDKDGTQPRPQEITMLNLLKQASVQFGFHWVAVDDVVLIWYPVQPQRRRELTQALKEADHKSDPAAVSQILLLMGRTRDIDLAPEIIPHISGPSGYWALRAMESLEGSPEVRYYKPLTIRLFWNRPGIDKARLVAWARKTARTPTDLLACKYAFQILNLNGDTADHRNLVKTLKEVLPRKLDSNFKNGLSGMIVENLTGLPTEELEVLLKEILDHRKKDESLRSFASHALGNALVRRNPEAFLELILQERCGEAASCGASCFRHVTNDETVNLVADKLQELDGKNTARIWLVEILAQIKHGRSEAVLKQILLDDHEFANSRIAACGGLVRFPTESTVNVLADIISREQDPQVAYAAGNALAAMPSTAVKSRMTEILRNSEDRTARKRALSVLGRVCGKESFPFIKSLSNDDADFRIDVGRALAQTGGSEAVEYLQKAIAAEERPSYQDWLKRVLAGISPSERDSWREFEPAMDAYVELLTRQFWDGILAPRAWKGAFDRLLVIARCFPDKVGSYHASATDPLKKLVAAQLLAVVGTKENIKDLQITLETCLDKDLNGVHLLRWEVCDALLRGIDLEKFRAFKEMGSYFLNHRSPAGQRLGLDILWACGGEQGFAAVVAAANNARDRTVRDAAVANLAAHKSRRSVDALLKVLDEEPDHFVRERAAEGIMMFRIRLDLKAMVDPDRVRNIRARETDGHVRGELERLTRLLQNP